MTDINSPDPLARILRKLDNFGELLGAGDYSSQAWAELRRALDKDLYAIHHQLGQSSTELHAAMHQHYNILQKWQSLLDLALRDGSTISQFKEDADPWLKSVSKERKGKPYDDEGLSLIAPLLESLMDPRKSVITKDRRRLHGGPVVLPAATIKIFTLLIDELSMNAMKYGAFGKGGGTVDIAWQVEGTGPSSTLVLDWRENCNSEIKPPATSGKGRLGITQTWPHYFNYQVEEDHQPTGLRYLFRFPHEMLPMPDSPHVLMVEDEEVAYLSFASLLKDTNINLSYAASVAEASRIIHDNREFDFVLLDRGLSDGDGFRVADELAVRSVPFAFFSGMVDGDWGAYSRALRIPKPLNAENLEAVLHAILTSPHMRRVR